MVNYFSVEYKTFIIVAQGLKMLPQVDLGLSYTDNYLNKWVIHVDYLRQLW